MEDVENGNLRDGRVVERPEDDKGDDGDMVSPHIQKTIEGTHVRDQDRY